MTETAVQAVDTPAPDANASPEATPPDGATAQTGSEAAPSPAVNDTDEKQAPKGVGKRIDELTRNWREAERREQALLDILRQQQHGQRPEPAKQEESTKTLADFDYDEGRYAAYVREQARKDAAEAARQELAKQQQQTSAQRRQAEFREREAKFAASHPDYTEVAHYAPVSDAVAKLVMELDEGPEVAYYLGKNHDIARKLSELPESRAAIELGRIETRLAGEREKASQKPVSRTPPPPPKVDAVEPAVNISPDDPASDKLSMDVWWAKRMKQTANQR